jgi:hypothetical protein
MLYGVDSTELACIWHEALAGGLSIKMDSIYAPGRAVVE